ncbi:protein kinase [Colletotrichum gloeosporioides Cg-14]|uniref:Protein kinase n=1 Tax=Colletotrichum gloeosporioides (strain Cg-14) TaxID=1237896 RepID=T0LT93_COLGC|nr:protein kinase [Colletotrichum gloeosporioides Cg-14]
MPHDATQEFSGLMQLKSSSKLILDDPKRVQKVLDRGEAFRLKRERKRQAVSRVNGSNGQMNEDSDDEDIVEQLGLQLDQAKISNALEPEKRFIPQPQFDRILTFESVYRVVSTLRCFRKEPNKRELAKQIYYGNSDGSKGPAVKLLAVLVGIEKVEDFAKHFKDGVRDSCLPLQPTGATKDQFLKCRKHGMHSTINSYLRPQIRESFSQWSHTLNAPFIKWEPSLHSHYVLETGDIIPVEIIDKVTQDDSSDTTQKDALSGGGNTYGGFSEVYKVKIHDGHWDFGDHGIRHPQEFFALKKLTSHNRNSFDLELSSLLFTGQNYKKKHLIQLLATFEVVNPAAGGLSTYYLLFDWAEGDLSKFWQSNEGLVGKKSHCIWMAEQFHEISEALQCVHNDRAPTMRYLENRDSNEDLYGRHGDIKPGNFLWFHSNSFPGLLALSDFGLGRLHTQVSRSKQDPRNIERSASYRCPEFDLPFGQVSPRSDIFSLGCVLLEYVTWFFLGFDAVENVFPGKRLSNDIYGFESDIFFSVKDKQAHIKPSVLSWIHKLQHRPDCSWYLWDLLEVIKNGMLEPNSDNRIRANQLTKRMHELLKACKADDDYYLGTRRPLK